MIVIIDYGMGNLRSILRKFERLGIEAKISSKETDMTDARKLILPGVGNFYDGMKNLNASNLVPVLEEQVINNKKPILGICLGMQLLTSFSEEGNTNGLGWVEGETKKFNFVDSGLNLRIPHVGWNLVTKKQDIPLLKDIDIRKRFYFTHSYYVRCKKEEDVIGTTNYGIDFHTIIHKQNIYGTQFHPEKSHKTGLQMISNFANYCN